MSSTLSDRLGDLSAEATRQRVLGALNLRERRDSSDYLLPAIGLFGAGILVGAALGVMLAPRPGPKTRAQLRHQIDQFGQPAPITPPTLPAQQVNPYPV